MSDLIDRQAAIDALNGSLVVDGKENAERVMKYLKGISAKIKALPPAQPERKKGKWIDAIIADTLPVIVCDQCNTFFPLAFGASHNFCPNCGADMREGVQDEQ